MVDLSDFAPTVAVAALVLLAGVVCDPVSRRLMVPKPLLVLAVGALMPVLSHRVRGLSVETAQDIVSVALVVVLFDGGAQIGARRFRHAAGPIVILGIGVTGLTTAGLACAAHWLSGLSLQQSLVLGAALAPTDPAVVFSVLGMREITGRTGTILEGEAGANDPVGIAVMAAVLAAGGSPSFEGIVSAAGVFTLQLLVGMVGGVVAGLVLLAVLHRLRLPSAQLYPLAVMGAVFATYAGATMLHGSGFLAVFAAGIVMGDAERPYLREVRGFHSGAAALCQLLAFTVLGLALPLSDVLHRDVVVPGLVLTAAMVLVIRPLAVLASLGGSRVSRAERAFLSWAGLKGAVPILLGTVAVSSGTAQGRQLFAIVGVVVVVSLLIQGSFISVAARWCGVAMRPRPAEPPWSVVVRFAERPHRVERLFIVGEGVDRTGGVELEVFQESSGLVARRDGPRGAADATTSATSEATGRHDELD